MVFPLSTTLTEKIQKAFNENPCEQYWDYSDKFTKKNIISLLNGDKDSVYEQISECCNHFSDTEYEHAETVISDFISEICEELGEDEDDFDFGNFWGDYNNYFEFYVDDNIEDLAKNTGDIRIRMTHKNIWLYSAYDMGGVISMDSTFGELVKFLKLNPQAVKKYFVSKGYKSIGQFRKNTKLTPLVEIEALYHEVENNTNGSDLVFYGRIKANELWNLNGKPTKATIYKNEDCGLFCSGAGGGSLLEMKLLQDITIDLDKDFTICFDGDRHNGYGIDDTYGLTREGWGKKNILLR